MTKYNVHLYREMRLTYTGIEADSPDAAAAITRDKPTDEADDIEDCDGETLSALVDEAGDDEYTYSRSIDFEAEQAWNAVEAAQAAIADATAGCSLDETNTVSDEQIDSLINALLEYRRQIAIRWSTADIREIRPDLDDDQAWELLQAAERDHNAGNGITWDTLKSAATDLFGEAPETGEA